MNASARSKTSFGMFAALPVLFFLLFGFVGMDIADRGFIPAFADRILHGEAMYQDFYYVRPPLTPYLHTFEMALFPDTWEMIGYRFFFYAFMWGTVLFSILALRKYFDFGKMGVSPWLLGCIGYVLAIHNFFASPWHTVDGIFFAALGILLISRGPGLGYLISGLFCLGLSAMAKQPFAVVPVGGAALVLFLYPWRRALTALLGTLAAAAASFALIEFVLTPNYSFWANMRLQTTGVTSFEEMKWSAFKLYVRPAIVAIVPGAALWYLLKQRLKAATAPIILGGLVFLGILVMAIGPLVVTILKGEFVMPKTGFYHGLLASGIAIAALAIWKRDRQGLAVLLMMLLVSWASSVSWGYASPVLYAFPALFAWAYFGSEIAEFKSPSWYWSSAAAIAVLCIGWLNLYPYHDDFRPRISQDLGTLFPKLSHISTGQDQYAHYADLKHLHEKFGDNFTVLPSMPAAHYVTNTTPRIQADWVHDGEINYKSGITETIQRLESFPNYVFAIKGEMHRTEEQGTFRCSVLKHVVDHWTLIDSTDKFWVYANSATTVSADR